MRQQLGLGMSGSGSLALPSNGRAPSACLIHGQRTARHQSSPCSTSRAASCSPYSSSPSHARPARSSRPSRQGFSITCRSAVSSGGGGAALAYVPKPDRGDAVCSPDSSVSLVMRQPAYKINVTYDATGRVLSGANRVWAHVGHSGWRHTSDIEMHRVGNGNGSEVWACECVIPTQELQSIDHLEVQMVFRGMSEAMGERWDNNGGSNWTAAVELAPGKGVVTAPEIADRNSLVSSLLLKIDLFASRKQLLAEQAAMLRMLAWCHDFSLLSVYEEARNGRWGHPVEGAILERLKARTGSLRRPGLHVIHIAAEMAPIAKVGGLADVVTSLAKAHQSTGTLAEIVLPKYDCIKYTDVQELSQITEIMVPWGRERVRTVVWSGVTEGLPVYFLEPHSKHNFFWRGRFYGEPDDAARFLFFSRAALEFLKASGKQPDVLHVHDWQSACIAPLLKESYRDAYGSPLAKTSVVLTIHNIAFQGWLSPDYLEMAGLDRLRLYNPAAMLDDTRPGFLPGKEDINVLKGGVVFADKVTTVSPTYAKEVFNPVFGMGLQGVLTKHAGKFKGILNGIDHEMWNPETDPNIPCKFSASRPGGKLECKAALLREVGLHHDTSKHPGGRPLLAMVSRLTEQKGLPLMLHGLDVAIKAGAQVIILGSAPDPRVQAQFEALAAKMAKTNDARLVLRHDEPLSHRVYAGADMILIPSAFEPCGLTQLIGLRYGTIPVVRETGGLVDTVCDVAHTGFPEHVRNGFTFKDSTHAAVEVTLGRAFKSYNEGFDWWKGTLVPRAMCQDWSWSRSAQDYLALYREIVPV